MKGTSLNGQAMIEIGLAGEALLLDFAGGVFAPREKTLIVADLHLEKARHFARRGQMLPPYDSLATLLRLEALVMRHKPERIVALGDSFHASDLSLCEGGPAQAVLERIARQAEILWITGNHDPDLPSGLPGRIAREMWIGRIRLVHQPGPEGAEMFGHFHPSARLPTRGGMRRCRCFLANGQRLLLPAFGALTGSMDLHEPEILSLFEPKDSQAFLMGARGIYPVPMTALSPMRLTG